ncbi:hypothetical protein [Aeromicrobium sp. A1-2]|uniref:hypothetical protein n=1 Tax=Aeromicrobium sp. A1-2 TaxID=2107713 RepID=UPI0013C2B47A|nr:hypothetical protein [Aeromicrobium sp. A1-2]
MGSVLVVGGINRDLTVDVARRPGAGETVCGGGKDAHHPAAAESVLAAGARAPL